MTTDEQPNPVDTGSPGRKWSRLLKVLTAAGVATAIGVVADVSQVSGFNLKDAWQHLHGSGPASATPAPSAGSSPSAAPPSVTPTSAPTSPATSPPPGSGGPSHTTTTTPVTDAGPTVTVTVTVSKKSTAVAARATITAPADGLTTTDTSVRLSISAAPVSVAGWVWYVVVKPAHHTTSDYLYRMRAETGTLTVGIGPATGGSGATDDYVIQAALIEAGAADTIGGYRDDMFAPAGTRYFGRITVHRESQ
ncbi:hypothetical protein [Paractinoplanes durhamensis]|uniref:Uncharacterized protein n=1 Tax=Paractinoplanes durhamensis TaxID=113563 RepID=A0ABQ3YU16_9ACTN|nr:hypothetical protein [Actinoplanes durhamensis]GIE01027.1 hypothetical protein Adu01nite_23770 [Actinoplanes durhamensis]